MPHMKTTTRSTQDVTAQWQQAGRPTPSALGGVIRQAKKHFAGTPGIRAAYRGWTTRTTADRGVQQYVYAQVERPGRARPIQRMRGYGQVTLFGTTTVGVRVKRPGRNQLVTVAA